MAFKWHFVAFMALTLWMAGCQTPAAQETNAANSQVANTERSQPSESAPGAMEHAQPPSADEIIATEAALASENSGATKPLPAEKKSAAKSKKTVAKSETPGQKTAPKELTSPEKTKAEPPPSESKGTAAVAAAEPTENKTEEKVADLKPETKSEAPGQETAPKELTSPEKTNAEPPPSESKGTAAVVAAEPTENKTEEKVADLKPETKSEAPGQETAPKELTSPEKTNAETPPSESKGTAAVAAAEPTENKTEGQSQPASSESKEIAAQPEPAKTETLSAKPKTEEITPSAQKSVSESPFIGTVVLSPLQKKFVVVDFRNGEVPPIRSELGVYREGIFVGSVRISEPVKPPLASADILSGALRRGDVVQ